LCEKNAVTHNPVKGVKRPRVENYQGKTPALGDHQARGLLDAPHDETLKGKRDRAVLATLLYHALRREELCKLTVKDFRHERRGVAHLKVSGKGEKTRYIPLHPAAGGLIMDYLEQAGHGADGSVAKNKKRGAPLCFSGQIINVRFQMASFSWGDDSELCPVVL
jgi:site-specific recombinase XerD